MDFDKLYAVDTKAADEGKWLYTKSGFHVKVAKLGNPNFVAEVTRLQKPHLALLRSPVNTDELLNKIVTEAMSKTILLDWEASSGGESIEYTPELGEQYMTKSSDFKEDVSELSASRDNFRPEEVAEK